MDLNSGDPWILYGIKKLNKGSQIGHTQKIWKTVTQRLFKSSSLKSYFTLEKKGDVQYVDSR